MEVQTFDISDVVLLTPRHIGDERGYFAETFRADLFAQKVGHHAFVQDNESRSAKPGTIRGLHFQSDPHAQGKLVRCTAGALFDVVVDIRQGSPTYGKWVGETLTPENGKQLWVPPGFAHGFLVLSETADFLYKTTDYYAPEHERSLAWNDPGLAIRWPLSGEPLLSAKDRAGLTFQAMEPDRHVLPR